MRNLYQSHATNLKQYQSEVTTSLQRFDSNNLGEFERKECEKG